MQIDNIEQLLRQNSQFSSLPETTIKKTASKLEIVSYQLGDTIVRTGDYASALYIVGKGKARMVDDTSQDKSITLAVLNPGDIFGVQSLLSALPAESSVRAAGKLDLLKLAKTDLDRLVKQFPQFRAQLETLVQQRSEFQLLRTLSLLSNLTLPEAQKVAQAVETIALKPNEFLFHEGSNTDAAYIVRSGSIQLIKESAANFPLAKLKPGELCGETTLLNDEPQPISAVASEETVIWRLAKTLFSSLVNKPKIDRIVNQIAENRRLQQQTILANPHNTSVNRPQTTFRFIKSKAERKLFAPSYYFAQVDNRVLEGLGCLATIDRFYWRQHNLQSAIERQLLLGQHDNLYSISRKAEAIGYMTRLLRLNLPQLKMVALPAIVADAEGHLSVILDCSKNYITLANPLTGLTRIDLKKFGATWNGQLLTVNYVPNFGNAGKQTQNIFQQFFPLARPYWRVLTWIGFISLVLQLLGLVTPLFSQVIIDKVLVHGDYSLLFLMLLGMLFATGFKLASGALRELMVAHALKRISVSLLIKFFNHVLSLPKAVFSQWQVGDFTVRFQENEKLLQLVAQSGFKIVIDSSTVLVYLAILLQKNAKLTGITLIFVIAYGLVLVISTPLLRANDRRVFQRNRDVESHLIETISGIETVKSIATENLFFHQGFNLITKAKKAEFRGALLAFNIGLISNLINQSSTIFILGYGAKLTLQGTLTTGQLVAFNSMLGLLLGSFQSLIGVWDELQEINISFERINDVLVLPLEQQDPTAIMPKITGHIRLENVYFGYQNNQQDILNDINLEILPGEKVAIVGRSGSGKTTLANLLIKLLQPTSGKIYLDQIDISNIELSSYRQQIGVVEQNPFLFNGTIKDNIAKANPTASLETVAAAARQAGASEFIESLPMQYETQIGERGMTLSGGQRQRLVIARALLNNPRILIMDEPTASLDSESERIILENLEQQTAGRTTITIAHRLSTIRNADRIVVLDRGRIVETGSYEELQRRDGLYSYLNRT